MPKVIGKDESVAKRVTCRNCSSVLEYLPIEVQEDYSTDYTGGKDYYKFIRCICDRKVIV